MWNDWRTKEVNGYDGWITYQYPVTGGAMNWNSTEVLEQQYPFKVISEEILENSVGAGKYDSAPSCKFVMTARKRSYCLCIFL